MPSAPVTCHEISVRVVGLVVSFDQGTCTVQKRLSLQKFGCQCLKDNQLGTLLPANFEITTFLSSRTSFQGGNCWFKVREILQLQFPSPATLIDLIGQACAQFLRWLVQHDRCRDHSLPFAKFLGCFENWMEMQKIRPDQGWCISSIIMVCNFESLTCDSFGGCKGEYLLGLPMQETHHRPCHPQQL